VGERRNAYKILVSTAKKKRPLGRLRQMSAYNVRMEPKEIEYEGTVWIQVAQGRD
jgi:hypothetical protein